MRRQRLDKKTKKFIKKTFKALLADEDKMKYLAYSTQMFPTIEKILNEQRADFIKKFKKIIDKRRKQQVIELNRYSKESQDAIDKDDQEQYEYSDEWKSRTVSILDELDWVKKQLDNYSLDESIDKQNEEEKR